MSFNSNANLQILWDIIVEDDLLKTMNKSQLNEIFNHSASSFYEKERNIQQSLVSLNKKFITQFIRSINEPKEPKELKESKQSVTFEELQMERKTHFEKDLAKKQNEFINAMNVPVPEAPNFSDNKKDEPIGEMASILAQTIAQRNYDIDQLHNNVNKGEVEKWIKGENTSTKYIKIDKENIVLEKNELIDLNVPKKQISWGPDTEIESESSNIFSKLKQISTVHGTPITLEELSNKIDKQQELLLLILQKLST